MNDILYINRFHKDYIHTDWLRELHKQCNIEGYTIKNKQELIGEINTRVVSKDMDIDTLEIYLSKWMYQGRKKLMVQFVDEYSLDKIKDIKDFKLALGKANLIKSDKLKSVFDFKANVDGAHLIDIKYIYQNGTKNLLSKVIFFYIDIVYSSGGNGVDSKIPFPVYISIDFENYEVISRVNAKSNLRRDSGGSLKDYNIAKRYLQSILSNFNISKVDKTVEGVYNKREFIYDIYKDITTIPEYIYNCIDDAESLISEFVSDVKTTLKLEKLDVEYGSLSKDIYNLLVKEYISELPEEEKKEIINDNFAYVSSITARGNQNTLKQTCTPLEAIQLVPEFHNIRSIIDIDREINNNTLHWKSVTKKETWIRSKLLYDKDILLLSIEESCMEEDIENVLSKIREYK